MLRDLGWDVERDGLAGAPPLRVLATEQRHGSIERALRLVGIGSAALVPLPTDADARLAPSTLRAALARSAAPTIVVLDAGDLNVGAFDGFADLVPIAREAGSWVHVDGAFGLWARASATHRGKTAGVEFADSWATDAHKWLNTPKDIGVAVVADREAHRAAMSVAASYISPAEDVRDQIDWTPDWTRRARGFPVYAALRELGRRGVGDLVDRCCDSAAELAGAIGSLPGAQLVRGATLNQALVRFTSPDPQATEPDHDAWTDQVIAAINADGAAFFSGTSWKGRRCMRISVVNWRTTREDVDVAAAAVARVLKQISRGD